MDLYRRLRFPTRAENLKQFSTYQVSLDHWKPLSVPIRDRFEGIYERGDSAVFLLHGPQGAGKTLFCDRLESDFHIASQGAYKPDANNLWHKLVGGDPPSLDTIRDATSQTVLRRIQPDVAWLAAEKAFATSDKRYKVRLFIIDDFQLDFFLCELAQFDLAMFRAHPDKQALERAIMQSLGQNIIRLCRNEFQRSLFVLASNRTDLFERIHEEIERSHSGLAVLQELPIPSADIKERIVRTNTNRLNNVSYWFCLDAAGPDEKKRVYMAFKQREGFTNSFIAVDNALKTQQRLGRPANRNTMTLVTLGTELHDVRSFVETNFAGENGVVPESIYFGKHLAWWQLREWASLLTNGDAEQARRAELTESEFSLSWLALGPAAVVALCKDPQPGDLGEAIFRDGILKPSFRQDRQILQAKVEDFDNKIIAIAPNSDQANWWQNFQNLGQRRSVLYEPQLAIRTKLAGFSYGVAVPGVPKVRPDIIVSPYEPCAVTNAPDEGKITIRRDCHTVEFTAFLGAKLDALQKYILEKAVNYAEVLESL
jgi:GTPase SAR1 family protein